MERDLPRIISGKFGLDWICSFRGEDFLNFIPPFFYFKPVGHLGLRAGSSDIILVEDHPRNISPKFRQNWLSGFRGDFFAIMDGWTDGTKVMRKAHMAF